MMKQIKPQSAQSSLRKFFSACFAISAVSVFVVAQAFRPALLDAQTSKTRTYVETLASPRLEGRLAGSNGERLASDFLVAELQKIGAKPLPGQKDFRLPFEFTAGSRDGGSTIEFSGTGVSKTPDGKTIGGLDWGVKSVGVPGERTQADPPVRALSFSDNGDVEAPLVFAGYGIVVPESQGFGYDSYATLDVKDKVVLVLRYFPEDADQKTRGILARYADLRYKAMQARQHGAKAMIVVTGPRSPNAGELAPMSFDTALAGSGIIAVTVAG
ncbi:MAG TPA: PA domain-containing protein, partial [Vicinamibacterales bacterium]|nr:PA domain-containing protein [Vicinamibacterales bacterium]